MYFTPLFDLFLTSRFPLLFSFLVLVKNILILNCNPIHRCWLFVDDVSLVCLGLLKGVSRWISSALIRALRLIVLCWWFCGVFATFYLWNLPGLRNSFHLVLATRDDVIGAARIEMWSFVLSMSCNPLWILWLGWCLVYSYWQYVILFSNSLSIFVYWARRLTFLC